MAMTRGEINRVLAHLETTSASLARLVGAASAVATELDLLRSELQAQVPATARPSNVQLRLVPQDDE